MQAAGASVIPAAALIIPVRYYEPKNRGHALGMVSMGLAIGTAVSPIVGGFIVQTFHWRVLFGLTLIVLVALPFFRKYLPDHPPSSGTIDALGAGLLAALVAFLLLAITWSNGWLTLAGILMLLLLIWRLTKAKTPFIQPALFGNRRYVTALVIGFLNAAVVMGVSFVIPQLLTELNGLSPGMVGFVVFPGAFISAVFGKSAGKLADRHGNPLLVSLAMTLMFLCFFLLSLMAGADPWVVALILIAGSVGQVSMQFGLSNTVSRTLTQEQVGIGMGLFSMIMFLSGAMSTVIIGKIIDYGDSSLTLNPLHLYASGTVYSNICAGMAVVVLIVSLLYFWHFGRTGNKNWQRGSNYESGNMVGFRMSVLLYRKAPI